jgi:hypothetical protein
MLKSSNSFIKPQPQKSDYQNLINVWIDNNKRVEVIKRLMLTNGKVNLQKLKTNPVYHTAVKEIIIERDKELEKLDRSLLWSRKLTPERFKRLALPAAFYCFVLMPYIFYKVIPTNLLEYHVKYGYERDDIFKYFGVDPNDKDKYPDKVIKTYFEVKQKNEFMKNEEVKAQKYSEKFVENISNGYITDFYKRRQVLGFNDDDL